MAYPPPHGVRHNDPYGQQQPQQQDALPSYNDVAPQSKPGQQQDYYAPSAEQYPPQSQYQPEPQPYPQQGYPQGAPQNYPPQQEYLPHNAVQTFDQPPLPQPFDDELKSPPSVKICTVLGLIFVVLAVAVFAAKGNGPSIFYREIDGRCVATDVNIVSQPGNDFVDTVYHFNVLAFRFLDADLSDVDKPNPDTCTKEYEDKTEEEAKARHPLNTAFSCEYIRLRMGEGVICETDSIKTQTTYYTVPVLLAVFALFSFIFVHCKKRQYAIVRRRQAQYKNRY